MAFCRCCFISAIPAALSHTERPVLLCAECGLHYGDAEKTAIAHDSMMAAHRESHALAMERLDERRQAAVDELTKAQEQARQLTATIASDYAAPLMGDAKHAVEHAVVAGAVARESAVGKARDRAMRVIARVDELHHEAGEQCSCGTRITQCAEFAALGPIRDEFHKWKARSGTQGQAT